MADKWNRGLPECAPMQIPDPLRPYLALLRWVLIVALALGIFIAGCSRGENNVQAEAAKAVAKAERERDQEAQSAIDNLTAANACGQALSDISDETREAEQRAAEWKAAADSAAARASVSGKDAAAKVAAAAKALDAARARSTCRAQLEMVLCPEIPLL